MSFTFATLVFGTRRRVRLMMLVAHLAGGVAERGVRSAVEHAPPAGGVQNIARPLDVHPPHGFAVEPEAIERRQMKDPVDALHRRPQRGRVGDVALHPLYSL